MIRMEKTNSIASGIKYFVLAIIISLCTLTGCMQANNPFESSGTRYAIKKTTETVVLDNDTVTVVSIYENNERGQPITITKTASVNGTEYETTGITRYEYTDNGDVSSMTVSTAPDFAVEASTFYEYDSNHRLIRTIETGTYDGNTATIVTEYQNNSRGKPISVTFKNFTLNGTEYEVTGGINYEYTEHGDVSSMIVTVAPDFTVEKSTLYEYDSNHHLIRTTETGTYDGNTATAVAEYQNNSRGQPISVILKNFSLNGTEYEVTGGIYYEYTEHGDVQSIILTTGSDFTIAKTTVYEYERI